MSLEMENTGTNDDGTNLINKRRRNDGIPFHFLFDGISYYDDHFFQEETGMMDSNEAHEPVKMVKRAQEWEPAGLLNDPAMQQSGVVVPQDQFKQRRLWVKDRSKAWWELCNNPDFPESEFKKAFRMSRATFDMICEKLDSAVKKKDTTLRLPIPGRQRVAVCIYRLATGEPLRHVSAKFGLGISTCHKLVIEVCLAIQTVLMPMFIKWPKYEKLKKIKHKFESMCKIPNVAGSIQTTHIPITAPKINPATYLNKHHTRRQQKNSYSVVVQGVVDSKGVFSDVSIGWPGSLSDDQVLEKSSLYKSTHTGFSKSLWIVGSSSYPLTDWLLTPYTHQNLKWTQDAFNEKLADIQCVAKESFTRLKSRWKCLQKRTELKLQDLPVVIGACCVLHNICEMRGDEMDPGLRFEVYDDEIVMENNAVRSLQSVHVRDQIAHNLVHGGRLS